jgi:integrase
MRSESLTWPEALTQFVEAEIAGGRAESSARTRGRRLARLADMLGVDPLRADATRVRRYLDDLDRSPSPASTVKAQRLAVRAFYRWAVAAGYRDESPVAASNRSRIPLGDRWSAALEQFEVDQAGTGIAGATVRQRLKYLRRLAASTNVDPWAVAHSDVQAWLDGLVVSPASRLAHRSAARVFYKWATSTGRVFADPMMLTYAGVQPRPVPPAWHDAIVHYRSHLRAGGRAETSIVTFMDVLRHFARQNTHRGPFEVTTDDLASWMGNKRWARETRRRNRQTLLGFYRWAVLTGRIVANPVESLPIVRTQQPHPRPAEDDEYTEALRKAGPSDGLALRLAAELGLRRGEVARVHSRDVQGPRGERELVVLGKGGKIRRVPLLDGLAEAILARPAGFLFPGGDSGHVSPQWLGRRIARLLPAGVTMHQLRHRFATRAYAVDRDLFGVQELLGHASPATTRGYVRLTSASLRRLVAAVAS